MDGQAVDAKGRPKIVGLPPGKKFDHVLEVAEAVVHGRGREQEDLLVFGEVVHDAVAGRAPAAFALDAGVPEVVAFVDDEHVGHLLDACQAFPVTAAAGEVGVVVDDEVAEVAVEMGQKAIEFGFPHGLAGGFGDEQGHTLAVVLGEAFEQHHAHEGLAQAYPIAQEGAVVLAGDFEQSVVAFLLVLVEEGIDAGFVLLPFGGGHFVATKVFLQGLGVDVKGGVFARVAFDDLQKLGGDLFGFGPMRLEPFLEQVDLALDLDVEFHVLGEARVRKIR